MNLHFKHLQNRLLIQEENFSFRNLERRKVNEIDFCSNDYLGFAKDGFKNKQKSHGASGSRLLSGHSLQYENLEKEIAEFHKFPAALIFNSGYAANIGLISCLAAEGDSIVFDEYIHASIRDGIKLSKASGIKFKHNNIIDAEEKLKEAKGKIWLLVESLYSMDGDILPLNNFITLAKKYNAAIIIDEAHALGTLGKEGKGLVCELNVQNDVFAVIYTYGKSFGSHGAAVCGAEILREYLINFSRPFIYSTALPNHTLSNIEYSYKRIVQTPNVELLKENITFFIEKAKAYNLPFSNHNSPIQSLIVSGNEQVIHLAKKLNDKSFYVKPIRYPTVPKGKERLRVCLHSFNSKEEIQSLIEAISNA